MDRPFASASARNAAPILGVLQHELHGRSTVFEIGSGTGQHAVTFAGALPELTWQTSDLGQTHDGIRAWMREAGLDNVLPPLDFDVLTAAVPAQRYDAVFSSNTAHIMGIAAVQRMFQLAGAMLKPGGLFCIYGPFSRGGKFNTRSNEEFDASLRERNPSMGLRDLDDLEHLAASHRMQLARTYAMPSNNLLVVWTKAEG